MNIKLKIIIETVLSKYVDANLLSSAAREKISTEIVNLYTKSKNYSSFVEEIISTNKLIKAEVK